MFGMVKTSASATAQDWRSTVSEKSRQLIRSHIAGELQLAYPKLAFATVSERATMLEKNFFWWSSDASDYFTQIRLAVIALQLEHAADIEQDEVDAKWLAVEKAALVRA
mmetsp:Transcript_15608/g.42037  ORF Transcript_15608/g.42037 Transcript_15608/m.42037 type:complete len:109 (-) Transcript_15608:1812-2138(-)